MTSLPATNIQTSGFTEESFKTFLRTRDEPSWLIDRRREAFARFQAFAWPTARDEEWRRTDIRSFHLASFGPPALQEPSAEARAALDPLWRAMSSHYASGIEHISGALSRQPDPRNWGGDFHRPEPGGQGSP